MPFTEPFVPPLYLVHRNRRYAYTVSADTSSDITTPLYAAPYEADDAYESPSGVSVGETRSRSHTNEPATEALLILRSRSSTYSRL